MLKILAAVDSSSHSARVIECVVSLAGKCREVQVNVIHVRAVMDSTQVHRFWSEQQIHEFQQKEGDLLLESARKRLDQAGVAYTAEVLVGDIANTIAAQASAKGCDLIVMGTRGMSSLGNLLMGSVATKVVHAAAVPVVLVK